MSSVPLAGTGLEAPPRVQEVVHPSVLVPGEKDAASASLGHAEWWALLSKGPRETHFTDARMRLELLVKHMSLPQTQCPEDSPHYTPEPGLGLGPGGLCWLHLQEEGPQRERGRGGQGKGLGVPGEPSGGGREGGSGSTAVPGKGSCVSEAPS